MIAEVNLFGVFINAGLVSALFAGLLLLGLRRGLTLLGVYRRVWHPALFDLAVFMLLWGLVVSTLPWLEAPLVLLLG